MYRLPNPPRQADGDAVPWHRRHSKVRNFTAVIVFAILGIAVILAFGAILQALQG
jgi:hypothetical protein